MIFVEDSSFIGQPLTIRTISKIKLNILSLFSFFLLSHVEIHRKQKACLNCSFLVILREQEN